MISDILILVRKDVLLEFRKRETIYSMGLFTFSSILIFSALLNFIDAPLETKNGISITCLLFIITFSVMLGLTSIFSREIKNNSIYRLLSLSIKPQVIFLSKFVYLFLMTGFIEIFAFILAIIFLKIDFQVNILVYFIFLTIGTLDLTIAGCIVAFLTLYAKSKSLAVPILFFPLVLPSVLIETQVSLNMVLMNDINYMITNLLILFFHGVIILAFVLLVAEELIQD
ncbi:MAG: hypothetical protein EAX86_03355 [Candidatus Heimdallarchaeota archaeon]|nr:hypothetical protein [Candidatus Heimdallarchaeota archaeon]